MKLFVLLITSQLFVCSLCQGGSYCIPSSNPTGSQYDGSKSTTASGRTCQRWDANSPHQSHFSAEANYCRNPDNSPSGPWCYTTDANKRWETCGFSTCAIPPTCGCQDELKKLQEADAQLKKSIEDLNVKLQDTIKSLAGIDAKVTAVEDKVNSGAGTGTQTGMQYGPCPTAQGWETRGKSCYKIVTDRAQWETANDLCTSYPKAHLAYVETSSEREYLLSQLKKHPTEAYFWLGGTDKKNENHWVWSPADITVQYADWYPGMPNNAAKIEHYMVLYLNGQYDDLSNLSFLAYVCEVNIEP